MVDEDESDSDCTKTVKPTEAGRPRVHPWHRWEKTHEQTPEDGTPECSQQSSAVLCHPAGLGTRKHLAHLSAWIPPACASTSHTTAPTSPAGQPSPACAPCRAKLKRRSPCCFAWTVQRCASPSAGARTPGSTPGARSPTSTSPRTSSTGGPRPSEAPNPSPTAADPSGQPLQGASDADERVRIMTRRLNGILQRSARDIAIHRVAPAAEGFDARFSATKRRYEYRLRPENARRDPLTARFTAEVPRTLNLATMQRVSEDLLGLQDFTTFCKAREGATAVRELLAFDWTETRDGAYAARIEADAFCHSMVRALVGSVVAVGHGRIGEGSCSNCATHASGRAASPSCQRTASRSKKSAIQKTVSSLGAPSRRGHAAIRSMTDASVLKLILGAQAPELLSPPPHRNSRS